MYRSLEEDYPKTKCYSGQDQHETLGYKRAILRVSWYIVQL